MLETIPGEVMERDDGCWMLPLGPAGMARIRLMGWDHFRRPARAKLAREWVARCLTRAEALVDRSSTDDSRTLFWIGLHDILTQVRAWLEMHLPDVVDGYNPSFHDPYIEAEAAFKAIVGVLTEHDLLVLAFFRHHAAHFEASVFSFSRPQTLPILNRQPSIDELTALFEDTSEIDEAKALAAKVVEPLRRLLGSLDALAKES